MTAIIQGLFGVTPDALAAQREQAIQQQALQASQMGLPQQARYAASIAGSRIADAAAGMLGGQDPAMQKASALKAIASKYPQTPEGFMQMANEARAAGYVDEAYQATQHAQAMAQQAAQTGKLKAEEQKIIDAAAQDKQLRDALAALGPNPTQEQLVSTVSQYGSPDKVLAVVQGAMDKQAAREQALALAKEAAQARVDAAKEAGANRLQIAQMQADSRREMASLTSALKQSSQVNKPLPASLQKEEGKDLETIDTLSAQQEALKPAIASLTPNAQGVRKLELGPVKNSIYAAQNATGNSTPESRAYEGLKSAVDTAVNLQVSAEKGVQTDKDVLRFAQALVAAYGRNDTKATLEALNRYESAIAKSVERTQGRLESRRKSQNVEAYGFKPAAPLGSPSNPIKLD